jgi:phosphonate transport system substrate-binding protein
VPPPSDDRIFADPSDAVLNRPLLRCLVAAIALACSDASVEPPVLRFSAIPDQDETRLREKFEPLGAYLSERLGVATEYVAATRYPDAVELFKNGDIGLAWFGGLTGVQARHAVSGARAIAQGEEDPEYYSYFIAHVDAGIEPGSAFPAAIAGKTFSFGSAGSTSGRLMPEYFIRQNTGKSPRNFLGAVSFSGSHDRTAELVESGRFQIGAINYQVYDRRVAEGTTDPKVAIVIWKTPVYPDYGFTAHPDLEIQFGEGFTDRLARALVEIDDPELLSAFPRTSLIPASNADFDRIEKIARELDFIR